MNVERLVSNEQKDRIVVFRGAMKLSIPFGKPHELSGSELPFAGIEDSIKHIHSMCTIVRMPGVGKSCVVLHLQNRHAGIWWQAHYPYPLTQTHGS